MSDIVERLRWEALESSNNPKLKRKVIKEAADEILQLRAQVERLHKNASLLFQNAIGCCRQHHGLDIDLNGLPGWLRDIGREIDAAKPSLPSTEDR